MLTEIAVIEGYHQKFGREMLPGDLKAFMRLAAGFDALHCDTYEEAHDAMQASIRMMDEECEHVESEEERAAIIADRLDFLHHTRDQQCD